jgi:hypothetical protein
MQWGGTNRAKMGKNRLYCMISEVITGRAG